VRAYLSVTVTLSVSVCHTRIEKDRYIQTKTRTENSAGALACFKHTNKSKNNIYEACQYEYFMMKPLVVKKIVIGKIKGGVETIKMTDVQIRSPRWDPHPEKSQTQNWEWRQGLFPVFENGEYDWMPLFKDLDEMARLSSLKRRFYVVFINRREPDKEYYWVPCKGEIERLVEKKQEIDKINSDLAKRHHSA